MTTPKAKQTAADLLAISADIDRQIAALPEAELLTHFVERLTSKPVVELVAAAGALAKALPPGTSLAGDYTVNMINAVNGLRQIIANRLAELASASA